MGRLGNMSEAPVTGEVLDESDERDSEFACGNCGAGIPDNHIGPRPTDMQVEAALVAYWEYPEAENWSAAEDRKMRAALRAAATAQ